NAAQSGGMGGVIKSYEDLVQVWIHKHLLYPKSARKRQLTGLVLVRFTLTPAGDLISSEIIEESRFKILNRSALKTIKRAVPFPTFPKEIDGTSRVFTIPIEYKAG
ncbi:MAG: energy transducer TonB, partial [Kordiimonas sp.]